MPRDQGWYFETTFFERPPTVKARMTLGVRKEMKTVDFVVTISAVKNYVDVTLALPYLNADYICLSLIHFITK